VSLHTAAEATSTGHGAGGTGKPPPNSARKFFALREERRNFYPILAGWQARPAIMAGASAYYGRPRRERWARRVGEVFGTRSKAAHPSRGQRCCTRPPQPPPLRYARVKEHFLPSATSEKALS